jgi:hypothetical protein
LRRVVPADLVLCVVGMGIPTIPVSEQPCDKRLTSSISEIESGMTTEIPLAHRRTTDGNLPSTALARSSQAPTKWHGWFLGNIVEIHGAEQENLLLVFSDPAHEQSYCNYFHRTHLHHDVVGLGVSLMVALMFSSRAEFSTLPAKVVRNCVVLAFSLNAIWFFTTLFAPKFALKYRNPAVYILSWFLHVVVACLPPLTYQSYRTPSSSLGAYTVRPVLDCLGYRLFSQPVFTESLFSKF